MQIIDLYDKVIEVTDLDTAIKQATDFMEYQKDDLFFSFDKERQVYWADLHHKLLELKSNKT